MLMNIIAMEFIHNIIYNIMNLNYGEYRITFMLFFATKSMFSILEHKYYYVLTGTYCNLYTK